MKTIEYKTIGKSIVVIVGGRRVWRWPRNSVTEAIADGRESMPSLLDRPAQARRQARRQAVKDTFRGME